MNFILFGFKSCGKTYFGQKLAALISQPFLDLDRTIESLYVEKYGMMRSCREICKHEGEQQFRELEKLATTSLKKVYKHIIALGGGAIVYHQDVIMNLGICVYLELAKSTLKERIFSQPLPSYFNEHNPEESFEKAYVARTAFYEKVPAKKINLDNKDDTQILLELKTLFYGQ